MFVHLRLETAGAAPLLASADVAQAARTALASRVRQHRCRVLALGGGADHLCAVLQFPASLPLSQLAQVARGATGPAVAHALCVSQGVRLAPDAVWAAACRLDTLSRADAAGLAQPIGPRPDPPEGSGEGAGVV